MARPKHALIPDFGAVALGDNPNQTQRVLGLVRARHSRAHIIEIGRYQGAWTAADVDRILTTNRVRIPEADPLYLAPAARVVPLNPTLVNVVEAVCQGMTNAEIAAALRLSPNTVRSYVGTILRKTGSRDRVALVVAVLTRALVPVAEED